MARAKGRVAYPPCGTLAAYRAHLRYGPPPCEECKKVNRDHVKARRARLSICVDCGRLRSTEAANRCPWCYEKYRMKYPQKRKPKRAPPTSN